MPGRSSLPTRFAALLSASVVAKALLIAGETLIAREAGLVKYGQLVLVLVVLEMALLGGAVFVRDSQIQATAQSKLDKPAVRAAAITISLLAAGLAIPIIFVWASIDSQEFPTYLIVAILILGAIRVPLSVDFLVEGKTATAALIFEGFKAAAILTCGLLGIESVSSILSALIIGEVAAILSALILGSVPGLPTMEAIRHLWTFSKSVSPTLALQAMTQLAVLPFLAFLVDDVWLGLAALAMRWGLALQIPQTALNQVVSPDLARAAKMPAKFGGILRSICETLPAPVGVMVLVFGLLVAVIGPRVQPQTEGTMALFFGVAVAIGFGAMTGPLAQAMVNFEAHGALARSWLVGSVVKYGLLAALVTILGPSAGLILALLASEILQAAYRLYLLRELGLEAFDSTTLTRLATAMIPPLLVLGALVWWNKPIVTLTVGLVAAVGVALTRFWSDYEILNGRVSRRLPPVSL